MKLLLVTLLLAATAYADESTTAFGYLTRYGVPLYEKLKAAEEALENQPAESRIVGGVATDRDEIPYQTGLLIDLEGFTSQAVCGGVLVSNRRALTAAHCWFDGRNQASMFTVVLGSQRLFTGGLRLMTSQVVAHPNWIPALIRNDIAMIYLPVPISVTASVSPVALPSGAQLNEDFAGDLGLASGFGLKADGASIASDQFLSHVSLSVITNSACRLAFPFNIQDTNICTSGVGGRGTCNGDSGGPLVVQRNGRPVLVGIVSFGSASGCETAYPAAYARVTSYMPFINQHL